MQFLTCTISATIDTAISAEVRAPTALSFTADCASAAKYTVVAKNGTTEKTVAIDVANTVPPVVITVTTP